VSCSRIKVQVVTTVQEGSRHLIGRVYDLDEQGVAYGYGGKLNYKKLQLVPLVSGPNGERVWENDKVRVQELKCPNNHCSPGNHCGSYPSCKHDSAPAKPDQAFKADAGKPRFELLMDGMPNTLLDVVSVLTWAVQDKKDAPWPEGGKGYVPHSWREVPEAKRRYRAAMQRHENAIARGEVNDPESGLPHRAHVATNALFLAELDHLYPDDK